MSGLSNFASKEIAIGAEENLSLMLSHSKSFVRKKAVISCIRVIRMHPESRATFFPRLKERFTDVDPGRNMVECLMEGVVHAAVSLLCEECKREPKEWLVFAPLLFQLLTTKSQNNWLMIKVMKIVKYHKMP